MPTSADRLAKSVVSAIYQAAQRDPAAQATLRAAGAWDFANPGEHPETTDRLAMAVHAVVYVGFDRDGRWRNCSAVVVGLLTFLKEETGVLPKPSRLKELHTLVTRERATVDSVLSWLRETYL